MGQEREKIKKKDKILEDIKFQFNNFPAKPTKNEKLFSIIIKSEDENILHSMICKNTNIFKEIVNKFLGKYPECKDNKNLFFNKEGNIMNINKTLEENHIRENEIIIFKLKYI